MGQRTRACRQYAILSGSGARSKQPESSENGAADSVMEKKLLKRERF
jgi:hypothetical protein